MGKKAVGALFLAAAALPAAQAFLPAPVPGTSRVLRAAPLRMCQTPAEFRAAAAKPLQQQALAAFSALCIGGAVAPDWSCGKCAGGVVDIDRNITYECE